MDYQSKAGIFLGSVSSVELVQRGGAVVEGTPFPWFPREAERETTILGVPAVQESSRRHRASGLLRQTGVDIKEQREPCRFDPLGVSFREPILLKKGKAHTAAGPRRFCPTSATSDAAQANPQQENQGTTGSSSREVRIRVPFFRSLF